MHMGRNPDWFRQQRARGVCYLCRRPMADTDPRLAHAACYRLQWRGWTVAAIRQRLMAETVGRPNGNAQ